MNRNIVDKLEGWFDQIDRKKTVVIAENRSKLANLFQRWLEDRYHVKVAVTEEQLKGKVDSSTDTVFVDRYFQRKTGELIQGLKAEYPGTRIILMTGVDPDMEETEIDADDYIVKPADRDKLIQKIEADKNSSFREKRV